MRGYSRTESRVYEISPTRTMTSDSTVAKTGRVMQISGSRMDSRMLAGQWWTTARNRACVATRAGRTSMRPRSHPSRPRRLRSHDIVGPRGPDGGGLLVQAGRVGGCALHLHDPTVAQPLLSCGHHDIAHRDAFGDLRLAVAPLTDVDLHAHRTVVDDLEQELLVALRHERLLRDDERFGEVFRDQTDAREHAGPQARILVLHLRADDHGAPGGI